MTIKKQETAVYPKVSIIIVNWNGWKDTIECIDSVFKNYYENYDVIIIDNCSSNDSVQKIIEHANTSRIPLSIENGSCSKCAFDKKNMIGKKIYLILTDQNYGFAIGNNIGINWVLKYIDPEYILLLNNDTIVSKDFLVELIKNVDFDETIGLASPIIYDYTTNKIQYSSQHVNMYTGTFKFRSLEKGKTIIESDVLCGASFLMKKNTVKKVGLLPINYFMLWEDLDYSFRVFKMGLKNAYIPTSKIWHKGAKSLGDCANPLRIKLSVKNRFIFWKKYGSKLEVISFLFFTMSFHLPILFIRGFLKTREKDKFTFAFINGLIDGLKISLQ